MRGEALGRAEGMAIILGYLIFAGVIVAIR